MSQDNLTARFWSKVNKDGPTQPHMESPCWEWTAGSTRKGYGRIVVSGKARFAHRIAYAMEYGLVPDDLLVCHRCDNPPCVRPDHLFLGDAAANAADMVQKGRRRWRSGPEHPFFGQSVPTGNKGPSNGTKVHPERVARGDRHGSKKHPERFGMAGGRLTPNKVRTMRALHECGSSYATIAREFSVSYRTARLVCIGESWRHVK